jgi:hypothetical protein
MRNAGFWSACLGGALGLLTGCSGSTSAADSGPVATCGTGCGSGLSCVKNSDFPSGICTATCLSGGCPSGMACSAMLSSGNSYCLQECSTTSCPNSLVCTPTVEGQLCLAPSLPVAVPISCGAPSLVVGAVATPPTAPAGCQNPVVPSALPPADVQLLGTHSPGQSVSFQVPAGAAGLSIVSQAVSGQNGFIDCPGEGVFANVPIPTPILLPGGGTFFNFADFNNNPPADLTTAPFVFFSVGGQQPYAAAVTFPNTSAGLLLAMDGGLPGGQWSLDVNDFAALFGGPNGCDAGPVRNAYDVEVVVTPGPFPATGNLNLDVYLVSESLTAATAVANAGVQRFAMRFSSFYANAGVCLGTVTLHDVPAWAKAAYSTVDVDDQTVQDPCSDFRQMFTLAAPGRTMSLFFVDEMTATGVPAGDEIVGKDGAIPGMATFNGTTAGGSAVLSADLTASSTCTSALDPFNCGPDRVALIAAHETGHFLGLFHPTEQTGQQFDPLVDTPSCVCGLCETNQGDAAACGNNPDGGQATVVDNSICNGPTQQCGGANLLMFWLLSSDMKGDITPEQAAVMRANPLISAP